MNQEFLSLSVTYCTVLILYSNDIYTCIPQGNPGRRSRNRFLYCIVMTFIHVYHKEIQVVGAGI